MIPQALGIPVLPHAPTRGTAARTLDAMSAANPTATTVAQLDQCTTPAQFTALVERNLNEIGTLL